MSANPFKIRVAEERQSLWDRVTRFTQPDLSEADGVVNEARVFLEWDSMPYAEQFKNWLQVRANQLTMEGESERAKAYLEMLQHLRGLNHRSTIATGDQSG